MRQNSSSAMEGASSWRLSAIFFRPDFLSNARLRRSQVWADGDQLTWIRKMNGKTDRRIDETARGKDMRKRAPFEEKSDG